MMIAGVILVAGDHFVLSFSAIPDVACNYLMVIEKNYFLDYLCLFYDFSSLRKVPLHLQIETSCAHFETP